MAIPCVVIDLKTNKRYTIDQFASELHNGLLKELVNENIVDNTKLKGRTELLNVSAKATEEVKAETRNVVEKAFNSVKNLIKKTTGKEAKLEYAKNRDEMIALVKSHGGTESDATSRGYYYSKDGTIVINEEYATSDTGGHEPTHPIIDALEAHRPELIDKFVNAIGDIKGGQEFIEAAKLGYPTLEVELPKLNELLEKAKADGKTEVANKIQERIDNINRDITQQKKEIITDFFAKISDGTFKVDQSNYEMVRDYILTALKAMGIKLSEQNLKYLDQKAVADLAKLVADKFSKGEEITAKDLGLEKFELIGEQNKLQQMKYGSFEKKGFEETKEYQDLKKEGYINEAFDIRTIAGRPAVTINPDNMITGAIFSEKGTPIIDGNGGIHFVSKYGDVWASSDLKTAQRLADYINKAREQDIANGGDGNIHVVVSKGSLGKTLTSQTGAKGSMKVLEYLVDESLIPLSDFRKALIEVGKQYGIDFNGKSDAKSIRADIANKFFGVGDSSFKSRGFFVRDLIKNLSENSEATHNNIDKIRTALNSKEVGRKIAFKYEGVRDAIGSLFADQMTQGVPDSHVYATIEVKEPVEVIEPEVNKKGSHESYPYHIRQVSGDKPKLNVLSETIHIKDVANPIEGKTGLGNDQTGMAEINIKPQFSKSETVSEPTTFTTRSGEPIGFNYNTDMVARERFDISKLKRLGGGSDRDVFDLGDGKLLKVAKTARGLEQNIYEGDGYLSFVPEMYERGANYVVVEKVEEPLKSNEGGVELIAMLKDLSRFSQRDFDNHNPELVQALEKYGLEDAMSYDVIWNDFTAKRNWGLKDGQPVHVDGGTFGGVKMLDRYRGKTNLSDPEFRQIYNQSKAAKKAFGDTDKYRQFSKSEVGETLNDLNPTGSVFSEYKAEEIDKLPLGENITTLDKTSNVSPDKMITVYRGVPKGENITEIKSGDFVTTNKQLAKDYAGTGEVLSAEVRADEILDDKTEPLGEDYILRKKSYTMQFSKSGVGKTVEETAEKLKEVVASEGDGKDYTYYLTDNGLQILNRDYKFNLMNEIFNKVGARKYASLIRKYIDPTFNKETLGYSNRPFADLLKDELHSSSRDYNIDQIRDLAKAADIKVDLPNPSKDNIRVSDFYRKNIAEAYHEGNNPSITQAIDTLLGGETTMQFSKSEVGDNPALKDETPILDTPKKLSSNGLQDLEIVSSKEANKALEAEIGGDKGVIDKHIRSIPIQEYDLPSNRRSKQVAEQIEENGWIEPLIVSYDKNGNVYIVEGQHRAAALKELGYDKAPVIVIHEKGFGEQSIKGTPPSEGMQFSKSEIPNAPKEVSIKNEAIDEARVARGAEPIADAARKTWGKSWDQAVSKIKNGESAEVLAAEVSRKPRALNDVEHAMLFMNELDLNNKYWNLIDKINKGEGDVKNLQTQLEDVKKQLENNEYAIRASGTETARGLAIRRWSKKANYSAESLKAEARAANKGEELDSSTKKALENKAKEIQDLQDAVDAKEREAQQKAEERRIKEAEAAEKKAIKELEEKVAFKTATKDEINTYIDKRRNRLADLITKRNESKGDIQLAKSELPTDYEELINQEIKEIAKGYFALGNMDMNSLVKAVHQDLQGLDPSFTERDVRDAISGYKSSKPRMTKPSIETEMSDLKSQMKAVSKLEDLTKGVPKQEGQKPTPVVKSKALTDLENQLADKMKEQKLWNELDSLEKEGLPMPKTRADKRQLSQDIQDLEQMIADKKKELQLKGKIADVEAGNLPQKGQPKEALSTELQKLQDEYNKKKRLLEISNEMDDIRSGNRKAPATKAEVDAEVDAAQKKLAETKRIDDMIKRSADLDRLDQDVNFIKQEIDRLRQMAKDTGDADLNRTADVLQQHLDDTIEANKKKPKETAPKSQKEIDLRNEIKKKEKELGLDGSDAAKLKAAKTRMQNRINELQKMIDTRNFDKPEKQEVVLDEEGLRLKAELERKKAEADKIIEEERIKNMTPFERTLDWFNKWTRQAVLSGTPVLGKLVTAGATRTMIAKPAEEIAGRIIGIGLKKLMPSLYKKAVVESGDLHTFRVAQVKAMSEWFKKENWGGSEFMKVLKTGKGTLDDLYGDKKYGVDNNPLEFFGRLHAALKSPTKRAEWLRSMEYRSLKALEMGEDISQPDVQYRLGAEAYIDAQRAIFMGDNAISQKYTNFIHSLEAGGNGGKLTAALMKILVPVVKIPTNYAIETLDYTPGVGASKAFYTILKNGFDNLTPEQADYLLRLAKKQGVGGVAFAIGMMNSDNIGGYYQENEKRGRDDVHPMDIRTPFGDISHTFLHSPLFEVMQMGATYARLHKKAILEGKDELAANKTGAFEAISGVVGQIPQAPAIQDLNKASLSVEGFENWLGSTANRVVEPQLFKNIAGVFEEKTSEGETVKRQPRGFVEQMLKGTGFDQAPIRLADYVDMKLGKDNKEGVAILTKLGALDDLTDITTKKYSVFNKETGKYTTIYLSRNQLNELNQAVRDKYIQLIKDNPVLGSKDPLTAFYNELTPSAQDQFNKLSKEKQGMAIKNLMSELLKTAKAQAKYEKGLTAYDESKQIETE